MRRSSSTTSRCGASSAGGLGPGAGAMIPPRVRTAAAARGRRGRSASARRRGHRRRSSRRGSGAPPRAHWGRVSPSARAIRSVCRPASFMASCSPFGVTKSRRWRRSFSPSFCTHVALVHQLLEHPAERLLGDLQHVEQIGDLHARMAVDEMQHAVVRAAEAELGQHIVGIADEVAVGEEQELDEIPDRLGGMRPLLGLGRRRAGRQGWKYLCQPC